MRKLLRSMAKARMKKEGYSKINKRMGYGQWRQLVNAYPVNIFTGERMKKTFHGNKKYKAGKKNPVFIY